MPLGHLGETNGSARLVKEDVYVIRALHRVMGFTMTEIGRRYGLPRETIRDIVNRKTWKHL